MESSLMANHGAVFQTNGNLDTEESLLTTSGNCLWLGDFCTEASILSNGVSPLEPFCHIMGKSCGWSVRKAWGKQVWPIVVCPR